MTRKELFFHLLEKELKEYGFKYLKSKNKFVKRSNSGDYIIDFNIWPSFIQVEANLKIVIKQIEDIKKKAWGKEYIKNISVGRQKSYLIENPEEAISWTDNESNIRYSVKKEIEFYINYGKQYFEERSNISKLNQILNINPGNELYVAYNPYQTIYLAIIVAKLDNHPKLLELYNIYREIIGKRKPSFLGKYDKLVNHLESHYPDSPSL
ncbi:hypothetical protein [Marinifilum sp.]|uniref:hypothetical protein n=1 Tax=Marinifilum sp. TaxID=2033137 RepID=UPI003BAA0E4D